MIEWPGQPSDPKGHLPCFDGFFQAAGSLSEYERHKDVNHLVESLRSRAAALLQAADGRTGGWLTVLRTAVERFNASRGSQAAASLSYYAFFSLFPLLLFILFAAGSIVGEARVYDQLVQVISRTLPVGREVVAATIDQVRQRAAGLQILAMLGLLWSGTGFFTAIVLNIDLAWPDVKAANLVRQRLLALLMVGVLLLLILLSLLLTIIAGLGPQGVSVAPVLQDRLRGSLWPLITRLLPFLVAFLLFLGLYWGVPKAKVRPQAAAGGALVAALGWQLASWGFAWVVRTGLANYELVYGSLGVVVALLFWMYLSSWILLFGAHLTAAIDRRGRQVLSGDALQS